ncbi:MAG: substrate-binding domain-containing protein [Gemmatimonadota bacterium]|nr:MAG: substrate-binding domain-containing protein [Gemmatimonadota bacterium]
MSRFDSIAKRSLLLTMAATSCLAGAGCQSESRITLALGVPTTVQDSGLLDWLLPAFGVDHPGIQVRFVAAGSGELLALGARGDLDVLLSHSPAAELKFVSQGFAVERRPLMQNDFLIVGPPADPAAVRGRTDAVDALAAIASAGAAFFSRGDESGTHRKELELRETGGIPAGGRGYRESGEGMGAVLRAASETGAYTLVDRATYLNLRDLVDLVILVEGDPRLLNVYSVLVTKNARQPEAARTFADWLTSQNGRSAIAAYGTDLFGRSLFQPIVSYPESPDEPASLATLTR